MPALRCVDGGERGLLSGLRMVDDADSPRGTGCRSGRLSSLSASRSDLVSAGISQQPICPLSLLAKHFALGSVFRADGYRALAFECHGRDGFSSFWNSGVAGHVVLVDCVVGEGLGGRAF